MKQSKTCSDYNNEPQCWVYRTEDIDGKIHFVKEPPNGIFVDADKVSVQNIKPDGVIYWFMPEFLNDKK